MKIKNSRLEAIRLILSTHEIGSQEELLKELNKEGYTLTQATLSRDLRQMRVVKTVGTNGHYKYVLTRQQQQQQYKHEGAEGEMRSIKPLNEENGFISIKFSGNIAVIRTRPSYASTLAYHIDNCDFPEILGTLAGDDTVMLVMAENVSKSALIKVLRTIIPNI
ncbi:MAG: arginine repressor [Bacteroidaceae bacterium]|nr:arginine repressor [Bacteroidaceae bacterium]